jgi:hypothetical protein
MNSKFGGIYSTAQNVGACGYIAIAFRTGHLLSFSIKKAQNFNEHHKICMLAKALDDHVNSQMQIN